LRNSQKLGICLRCLAAWREPFVIFSERRSRFVVLTGRDAPRIFRAPFRSEKITNGSRQAAKQRRQIPSF
jgi:hypothetical protein